MPIKNHDDLLLSAAHIFIYTTFECFHAQRHYNIDTIYILQAQPDRACNIFMFVVFDGSRRSFLTYLKQCICTSQLWLVIFTNTFCKSGCFVINSSLHFHFHDNRIMFLSLVLLHHWQKVYSVGSSRSSLKYIVCCVRGFQISFLYYLRAVYSHHCTFIDKRKLSKSLLGQNAVQWNFAQINVINVSLFSIC
jgi:hypothetical protein